MNNLSQAERELLTKSLRCQYFAAADLANGLERTYGVNDGRSKEAWKKAQNEQAAITALGKKLGLPV